MEKKKERERDRQTDRQADRQTERTYNHIIYIYRIQIDYYNKLFDTPSNDYHKKTKIIGFSEKV